MNYAIEYIKTTWQNIGDIKPIKNHWKRNSNIFKNIPGYAKAIFAYW